MAAVSGRRLAGLQTHPGSNRPRCPHARWPPSRRGPEDPREPLRAGHARPPRFKAGRRQHHPGHPEFHSSAHPPTRDAAVWLADEIMPRVWANQPSARLQIVGSAPPGELTALAGPGVEVVPDVPDVQPFLEGAAVCVAPVRTGGGMRMKVLYAL